jgi:hypothetical protein
MNLYLVTYLDAYGRAKNTVIEAMSAQEAASLFRLVSMKKPEDVWLMTNMKGEWI